MLFSAGARCHPPTHHHQYHHLLERTAPLLTLHFQKLSFSFWVTCTTGRPFLLMLCCFFFFFFSSWPRGRTTCRFPSLLSGRSAAIYPPAALFAVWSLNSYSWEVRRHSHAQPQSERPLSRGRTRLVQSCVHLSLIMKLADDRKSQF